MTYDRMKDAMMHTYLCNCCFFNLIVVCPNDKTETVENKIAKVGTEIVHRPISNIGSKGQGHTVKKCKSREERRRRTAGVSYALYRVPSL